jgi:dipeptide/tripeptide permease
MIVTAPCVAGWYLFEQAGTSLNLYADRNAPLAAAK